MKYLKEGKWDEFKGDASHIFKRMDALNSKYENDMYAIKQEFDELNNILYDEIAECMVDLEDYQTLHIDFNSVNDPDNQLCLYTYYIKDNIAMSKIYDVISKLNEYIGDNGYDVYYNSHDARKTKSKNVNLKYNKLDNGAYPITIGFDFHTIQV